ncbi:MAG: preprotein translocase subunit SecA, partial [Corynebacterium kroppenstedtii]|nr:preprotein translocase subunit SecA [Corynebacterium kroppenstedtii]
IDEARTPLIISGPVDATSEWYTAFANIVPKLKRDIHYEVDERKRTVGIREEGVELVEDQLGIDNLYAPQNSQLVGYLNNAIKAKELFVRDKDYIVRNGEVLIVDEFTGRVLSGRRYNEGMHQAIEAKEGVEIQAENQTLATITLQNYFRLYDKLAGMTGTAETEASELHQIYKLDVNQIPTNRPNQRIDKSDLVYKTQEAKFRAVADDIEERVQKGQPVLVGTTSVERSEYLSHLLQSKGVRHSVLNAKHHEEEAQVVAQAGRLGAVTVATNMAGRGTDIVLGGNPDIIADINLRQRGLDPVETPEEYEQAWDEEIARVRDASKKEAKEVCEAGGLYVLGTERHESRRIDNQLRGRCARQGDPGETRFYLSMRDELMTRFVGPSMEAMMNRLNVPDDVPIEAKMVTNAIKSAQTQVESQNFEMRKNVLKYDEVMNSQRKVIYAERRQILEGLDLRDQVRAMIDDTISAYVYAETADGYVEDWDLGALWNALESLYGPTMSWQSLIDSSEYGPAGELPVEDLRRALIDDALAQYEDLEKVVEAIGGDEQMRNLERYTLLNVVDQKWREHLYEMDYLKEGIGLRAMAQRDPLVEYQREGGDMFRKMEDGIKEEAVRQLFMVRQQIEANKMQQNADVNGDGEVDATDFAGERQEVQMSYSGPDETGSASAVNEGDAEAQPKNRRERRAAARAQRKSGRHAR